MELATGFAKAAFAALSQWPLVQGSVAILVLVFAALLARGALKERLPPPGAPPQPPIPIQVESPWMTQNLLQMQLDLERIADALKALNSKVDGIASLLKRRQARREKK